MNQLSSIFVLALALSACSSAKKKEETPELSDYAGKKVALVEVEGTPTSKKVVETALINQLIQNGTFIIVSKQNIEEARRLPETDPRDWKTIARKAGAEYALRANVLNFDAETREGYSNEKVFDSQLAEDLGEDHGETERLYKVRALEGNVRVNLAFTNLEDDTTREAVAEAQDKVVVEAKTQAAHLPPKLRFMENLANQAFKTFFEKYD